MTKAPRTDTWMPLYLADYLSDTTHLTTEQHGAYLLLLMTAWKRGGSLPNDETQLAAICRLQPATWRKHRGVLLSFFTATSEGLSQKRISAELSRAREHTDKRSQAGQAGARARWQSDAKADGEQDGKADSKPDGKRMPTGSQNDGPSPPHSSDPDGSAAGAAIDDLADLRAKEVRAGSWGLALKVLMSRGGFPEARARPLVGKWAKTCTPTELWQAAEAAWKAGTLEPVSYINAALEGIKARTDGEFDPMLQPEEWRQRKWVEEFVEGKFSWDPRRGPRPGEPGCRVSPAIQREFGIEPAPPQPVTGRSAA
ncbi:MAG TPA: DUF1376 domain-containing protein [Acetobacteraceae bacterium]|nr:DUF1376 domain-containing protein [Acetobacteraceae bacterium]